MHQKTNYKYHPKSNYLKDSLWKESFLKGRSEELSITSVDRYYGPRAMDKSTQHDFWEVGCIVRGSIEFGYNGNSLNLKADTVFVIPPNVPHFEKCTIPADIIWISLTGSLLNNKTHHAYMSVEDHELACMIEKLWIFTEIKETGTGPELDAKIMEIVSRFFRVLQFGRERQTSDMIEKTIIYLNSHMSEPIAIPDIAKKMGCSETYFRRLFKMHTGRTPVAYLQELRVRHSKSLLKHTNMTISEIADSVGYQDAFYFTRVFTKACGISPNAFRNFYCRR